LYAESRSPQTAHSRRAVETLRTARWELLPGRDPETTSPPPP